MASGIMLYSDICSCTSDCLFLTPEPFHYKSSPEMRAAPLIRTALLVYIYMCRCTLEYKCAQLPPKWGHPFNQDTFGYPECVLNWEVFKVVLSLYMYWNYMKSKYLQVVSTPCRYMYVYYTLSLISEGRSYNSQNKWIFSPMCPLFGGSTV